MTAREEAWAVWNRNGGVYFDTIRSRRTASVSARQTRSGLTWSECYRRGDRAVQVEIRVTEKDVGK